MKRRSLVKMFFLFIPLLGNYCHTIAGGFAEIEGIIRKAKWIERVQDWEISGTSRQRITESPKQYPMNNKTLENLLDIQNRRTGFCLVNGEKFIALVTPNLRHRKFLYNAKCLSTYVNIKYGVSRRKVPLTINYEEFASMFPECLCFSIPGHPSQTPQHKRDLSRRLAWIMRKNPHFCSDLFLCILSCLWCEAHLPQTGILMPPKSRA